MGAQLDSADVGSQQDRVALNADVVGYSRLLADDFDSTTAAMAEYQTVVESEVSRHKGIVINFVGDNFMAVFERPTDAVASAISIATEVESRNAHRPGAKQIRFRMGIDEGEITSAGDQYFGDALNIAARIQALAPSGGLSISGRVYRSLDEPELRFKAVGRRELHNIPEGVDIYEFADLPSNGQPSSTTGSLALESPTVAVLPIHSEHVEQDLRITVATLRADLIHRLTQVPQLEVVDTGVERPGQSPEVSPRYMIESGAHQGGQRVRVYVNVFDVLTMNIVKSHRWTVNVDELFDLSETLADDVARSLEVDLIVGEPAGLYADLADPDAIEAVYLGWYHLTKGTPEGWAQASQLFERVTRSHPDQPYGYNLVAFGHWMAATYSWTDDPDTTLEAAKHQANLAIEKGDKTGMAQMVVAAVLMTQGRGEEAIEMMERVEISRPTCDATYGLEGSLRRYMGQYDEAVDLTDRAMRLTGVNKPWYPTVKACSLFMSGKAEQASTVAEMVLDHHPNNLEALLVLAAAQVELGLERRARATANSIRERFPAVDVEEWLDRNPFQDQGVVDRWKADLIEAGVLSAG